MASEAEIKRIDLRRLAELEVQRAYKGIGTEPEVMLEIADLRQKYGSEATAVSRDAQPDTNGREPRTIRDLWNEVDFLRAMCVSILTRMNGDAENRVDHQRIYTVWMFVLTLLLFYALVWR